MSNTTLSRTKRKAKPSSNPAPPKSAQETPLELTKKASSEIAMGLALILEFVDVDDVDPLDAWNLLAGLQSLQLAKVAADEAHELLSREADRV